MIHYTPFPAEWYYYDFSKQADCYTVEWNGIPMVIQWDDEQGATIVQLLSLDPQHYLDPRYQPGNKVEIWPKG